MTLRIDDLLAAICTSVSLSHSNDFQNVYALEDDLEAKLAFDILVAYGFAAKVYHTPGKPSKLYVANSTLSPEQMEKTMAVAIAYAHSLKQMKSNLDQLCSQSLPSLHSAAFTMTFVNAQPSGKQITIQITPPAGTEIVQQAASTNTLVGEPGIQAQVQAQISSKAPVAAQAKSIKKVRKTKNPYEDDFAAGPAVGRGFYPTKIAPEGGRAQESMRKRLFLRVFGNMATSSFATLMWLVLVFVLFSFFVFAKAFICYDFVAKKKNSWYCNSGQVSEEEYRKQQQLERQKALGLAPAETPP